MPSMLRFAPLRHRLLATYQFSAARCSTPRAFSLASNLKGKVRTQLTLTSVETIPLTPSHPIMLRQEKVEEDLFMKKQEKAFFEQKRAEVLESERKAFQETIDPTMAEVNRILKSTNDSVSQDGLEALARWKTGL